mmetsp:Transcript_79954/g.209984  ORF Transcript_79954/g.209984 Transcript_79954/m.209984 type:complete len:802 (-) Transcript_79954:52-2457(-)
MLGPKVLLHREGVVRAALHRGVVRDKEHLAAVDKADAGHDAGRLGAAVVHVPGCQGRELQELRPGVDDRLDALARQGLASLPVLLDGLLAAAGLHLLKPSVELRDQSFVVQSPRLSGFRPRCRQLQARGGWAGARAHTLPGAIPDGGGVSAALGTGSCALAPPLVLALKRGHRGAVLDECVHDDQVLPGADRLLGGDADLFHGAVRRRRDLRLEFHGREQQEHVAFLDLRALRGDDLDDHGLQRRGHGQLLPPRGLGRAGVRARRGLRRGVVLAVQLGAVPDHEGEQDLVLHELGVLEDVLEDTLVRVHAVDLVRVERRDAPLAGGLEGRLPLAGREADELSHEWVVVHARLAAAIQGGVHAHAVAGGLAVGGHLGAPARRQGDAALDGGSAQRRPGVALAARQAEVPHGVAAGDQQLGLHDVHPGHLLGDGVLDLDPRVHLHEDEVRVGIVQLTRDHELHGANAAVVAALGQADGAVRDALPQLRVHPGGGRLHDLLVPDLHAAVALEEVDRAALPVGHDLHLDVARVPQELLEEDGAVAEGRCRLSRAAAVAVRQVRVVLDDAHAAAAAAEGRLEHDGQRDGVRLHVRDGLGRGGHEGRAAEDRHAAGLRQLARADLVAEQRDGLRPRAHEADAAALALLRQRRALAEEAVAGVHGAGAGAPSGGHDAADVQVGRDGSRRRRLHLQDLIDLLQVQRARVLLGVDADGLEAHFLATSGDAHCDLPAVRDKDLVEWQRLCRSTPVASDVTSSACAGDVARRAQAKEAHLAQDAPNALDGDEVHASAACSCRQGSLRLPSRA